MQIIKNQILDFSLGTVQSHIPKNDGGFDKVQEPCWIVSMGSTIELGLECECGEENNLKSWSYAYQHKVVFQQSRAGSTQRQRDEEELVTRGWGLAPAVAHQNFPEARNGSDSSKAQTKKAKDTEKSS